MVTISTTVIARERVTQYPRALSIESRSRGVLDTPLSRGMTGGVMCQRSVRRQNVSMSVLNSSASPSRLPILAPLRP